MLSTEKNVQKNENFKNINLAIMVPYLNITIEDFVICLALFLLGSSLVTVASYVSEMLATFIIIITFLGTVSLLLFVKRKVKEEILLKGISRTSVLKKYMFYISGANKLRGR
ncbi:MAG: hypothetical protein DDT19_00012 [Syntrophomonadaceae bacterium]|nr:hypothetical protein [Bacillota bacterium]